MGPDVGDGYLRAVYDWNWRAAVDCLAATDPVQGPFSALARTKVLALLSERRSDPVDGTQRRATRLLHELPDPLADRLARAPVSESENIIWNFCSAASEDELWLAIYCR